MNNGLIIFSGAVETLEFFSKQLAIEYEKDGYEIFTYKINEDEKQINDIKKFISSHKITLLTFNFIGLSGESFLKENGNSIFSLYEMKKIVILVDHPIYYHDQLVEAKSDITLYCVDEDHVSYIEKYYPQILNIQYMPLAGTELSKSIKIFEEKKIPLLFTGNYVPKERLLTYLDCMEQDYKNFYHEIVEDFIAHPNQSLQYGIEKRLNDMFPEASNSEIAEAMHGMLFIDLFIRSYFRAKIVQTIADANIPIYLVGKDWNYLETKNPDCIRVLGNGFENTMFCLEKMKNARLSLNVMPWFKRGFHDRIPSSMLQRAVCITDGSQYIDRNFRDGHDLILFNLEEIQDLPTIINEKANNIEELKIIARNGYKKAKSKHTWKERYLILKNN